MTLAAVERLVHHATVVRVLVGIDGGVFRFDEMRRNRRRDETMSAAPDIAIAFRGSE